MGEFLEENNPWLEISKIESLVKKRIKEREDKRVEYSLPAPELVTIPLPKSSDLFSIADINVPRVITSHRRVVGPSLVRIRLLLEEEMRMSFEPLIQKQIEFNKRILEHLNNELQGHHEFDIHLRERVERAERFIEECNIQINQNVKEIFRLQQMLRKAGKKK